jgi:putative acetyltransferase
MDSSNAFTYRDIHAICPETAADQAGIHAVVTAAFARADEAQLVDRLRSSDAFIPGLSLCLFDCENVLVGHVLFTRCQIVDDEGYASESLALAPLSVLPSVQGKGLGGGLVRNGLLRAEAMGFGAVIVLGNPVYYRQFGFQPAADWAIHAPFPVKEGTFQVLPLHPDALVGVLGTVRYPAAFQL